MQTCKMTPVTANDDHGEHAPPRKCGWEVTDRISGVELCWTHAAAVRAGTRALAECSVLPEPLSTVA